jgi:hypothetical protein
MTKRTSKKTKGVKKAKKFPRFVKGHDGRVIDTQKITKGKFVPVEAGYVPPFRKSAHFVVDNKGWQLIHGTIRVVPAKWLTLRKQQSMPHAWVEGLKMVFDPEFNIYMNRRDYYKLFKVTGVKKYSFAQMRVMLDKKRRYGRWEEILCFEQL